MMRRNGGSGKGKVERGKAETLKPEMLKAA
jgi:hypothetical protein